MFDPPSFTNSSDETQDDRNRYLYCLDEVVLPNKPWFRKKKPEHTIIDSDPYFDYSTPEPDLTPHEDGLMSPEELSTYDSVEACFEHYVKGSY